MIDFIGTSQSLRKALWFVMAFSHNPNWFIYGDFFRIQGLTGNNLAPKFKIVYMQMKSFHISPLNEKTCQRTSDSLNEGLPIKMAKKKKIQRK